MKQLFLSLALCFLVAAPVAARNGMPNLWADNVVVAPMSVSYLNSMAAALIPFALIHLFLFLCAPRVKANLYLALTAMSAIAFGFAIAQGGGVLGNPLGLVSFGLVGVAGARLLYALFATEAPVHFQWLAAGYGSGTLMWAVLAFGLREEIESWNPIVRSLAERGWMIAIGLVIAIVLLEMVRVLLRALRAGSDGGWIIAAGIVPLLACQLAAFGFFGVPEIGPELRVRLPFLGVAAFVLSGSALLARQFGRMHRDLLRQTAELAVAKQRLEGAWQRADTASQAKTVFLKNLNQELRSPVKAMLECAKALGCAANVPENQRETIQSLAKSGRSLLAMIDDMLDLSRIEAGRIESQNADFDLGALIEGLIAVFRVQCEEKQLAFKVEWDSPATSETGRRFGEIEHEAATHAADSRSRLPSIPVNGDEGKLRQVLANLLDNAVKFTDRGSVKLRISFVLSMEFSKREAGAPANPPLSKTVQSSEPAPGSDVLAEVPVAGAGSIGGGPAGAQREWPHAGGEFGDPNPSDRLAAGHSGAPSVYRFEVIDTGAGISHGAQLRLFEPFQREAEGLKRGGIGLGLALARHQVEIMGGNLRVQSELGKGARFYFDVPLAPAKSRIETADVAPAVEISRLAAGHFVNALVVDDVRENRDVLMQLLSGMGCGVRGAENGIQALALLREELPQIVFMDIRMPGMWGDEALQRIAAEFGEKKPRVVAISASALAHERESYMKAGFDEFLSKPVRFHLLCDTLWRLLNVEFEYAETTTKDFGAFPVPDPDRARIPGYLRELLRQAVGNSSAAKLDKALQELEKTGDREREIAGYLRHLARQGDLDAVTRFLRKVKAR